MGKIIFHVIDSLSIGGAEQLLARVVPELTEYENIIITLKPLNDFLASSKSSKVLTS